jgi:hypothetical protein
MSKAADLANLIGNINAGGGGVNRNLVINGDMSVSQRATSVSSITGAGYKVLDRHRLGGAVPGTWTWSQSTTVPSGQGFANSLKLDCTATASAGTMYIQHKMEGQNLQGFAKGTSDAKPFALSFWVRSNKTGTYIAQLLDNDNTRHVSKSYTISSANTWEHKKITFPADTTGAFGNDNGASLEIYLWLSADSNNSSGTLATTWASVTAANNAVGQVNLADSTDNEWYLTGLQLEIGQNPTEFEHEPFERTLAKCYRYFYIKGGTNYAMYGQGRATSTTRVRGIVQHLATMRSAPSFSATNVSDISVEGNAVSSISTDQATTINIALHADVSSGLTTGQIYRVYDDGASNSRVSFDSEL